MPKITPTPGRVVQFYHTDDCAMLPHEFHRGVTPGQDHQPYGPYAATVAWVWNDNLVNLGVHDAAGRVWGITNVRLVQEGQTPEGKSCWCQWMPFQLGQARAAVEEDAQARRERLAHGMQQDPAASLT